MGGLLSKREIKNVKIKNVENENVEIENRYKSVRNELAPILGDLVNKLNDKIDKFTKAGESERSYVDYISRDLLDNQSSAIFMQEKQMYKELAPNVKSITTITGNIIKDRLLYQANLRMGQIVEMEKERKGEKIYGHASNNIVKILYWFNENKVPFNPQSTFSKGQESFTILDPLTYDLVGLKEDEQNHVYFNLIVGITYWYLYAGAKFNRKLFKGTYEGAGEFGVLPYLLMAIFVVLLLIWIYKDTIYSYAYHYGLINDALPQL